MSGGFSNLSEMPQDSRPGAGEPARGDLASGSLSQIRIACTGCGQLLVAGLTLDEFNTLLSAGTIARHCPRCGTTTRWKPSDPTASPSNGGGAFGHEQRRSPRFNLIMPVQVRSLRGLVDFAPTHDVSKAGLCIHTTQHFTVGEEVEVILHFADTLETGAMRGKITWTAQGPGDYLYGVAWEQ